MAIGMTGLSTMPVLSQAEAAGEITRVGSTENLMQNNKADIRPEVVNTNSSVALNRFTKFSVDNNEVANLYFNQVNGPSVNTLVNMVQNQISVSGTVNAIRNNQIGGNLYFLSPAGMVIGSTGAINAGSLTVMTPTADFFEKANGSGTDAINLFTETVADKVTSYLTKEGQYLAQGQMSAVNDKKETIAADIPLNKTGSIDVHGTINAATAVKLMAANINVNADANAKTNPLIRTGVIFENAVNTDNSFKSATVNSTKSLEATISDDGKTITLTDPSSAGSTPAITGNGSITLAAQATELNYHEPAAQAEAAADAQTEAEDTTARAAVVIGQGASIVAVGDVNISSNASMTTTINDKSKEKSSTVQPSTLAETTVAGNISGANVNITATSSSVYTAETSNALANMFLNGAKTDYADKLKNVKVLGTLASGAQKLLNEINVGMGSGSASSSVNVGDSANIKATAIAGKDSKGQAIAYGGNINVSSSATSNVGITMSLEPKATAVADAEAADKAESKEKASDTTSNAWLNSGFAWVNSYSSADTTVTGKLESSGDTSIEAKAEDKATTALSLKPATKKSNDKTDESNSTTQSAYINLAIGLINQGGSATVNIGSETKTGSVADPLIKAGGGLTVSSKANSTTDAKIGIQADDSTAISTALAIVSSDNNATTNMYGAVNAAGALDINATNTVDSYKAVVDNAYGKEESTWTSFSNKVMNIGFVKSATDKIKGWFGIAKDDANKAAEDKKSSDESSSGSKTKDASSSSAGVKSTDKDDATQKTGWNQYFDVGASVLLAKPNNTAVLNIEPTASIKGGSVDIAANVQLQDSEMKAKNLVSSSSNTSKLGASAGVAITTLNNTATLQLKEKDAKGNAVQIESSGAVNIGSSVESTTTTTASATASSKTVPVSVAGTVGIQNIHNTATTDIGKSAVINAGMGAVGITANVTASNKLTAGNWDIIPRIETASASTVGIGGTVGIQNSYSNSKVTVQNGVAVTGGSIDVSATNYAANTSSAVGGSKAGTAGISGMVSYLGGESNANASVDDDAKLTAQRYYGETPDYDEQGQQTGTSVKELASGAVNITSNNTTTIIGAAGEVSRSSAAAIGASVSVISYDVQSQAKVINLDAVAGIPTGVISANAVNVNAVNDGIINNLAVAGVASSDPDSGKSKDATKDTNSENAGNNINIRDKSSSNSSDSNGGKLIELQDLSVSSEGKNNEASNPTTDKKDAKTDTSSTDDGVKTTEAAASTKKDSAIKLNLAGSVTWTDIDSKTEAELSTANIKLTGITLEAGKALPAKTDGGQNVVTKALDTTFIGSYSGAMALTKQQGELSDATKSSFSGTLSGAVAVNDIIKNTSSTIGTGTVSNAYNVNNIAENSGTQVAAGLSLGIQSGDRKSVNGFDMSASGSFNYITSNVESDIKNAAINGYSSGSGNINNIAYDKDIQVAGGITGTYAKGNVNIGASVASNKITNNISAEITKSQLGTAASPVGAVNNFAASKLTQIAGAISVGITNSASGFVTAVGAVAVNTVNNTLSSQVDNDTIYTTTFDAQVMDGRLNGTAVAGIADTSDNKYTATLQQQGFDVNGQYVVGVANGKNATGSGTEASNANTGLDISVKKKADGSLDTSSTQVTEGSSTKTNVTAQYTKNQFSIDDASRGNLLVGSAISVAAKTQTGVSVNAAAGVALDNVTNNFSALVDNSTIKTAANTDNSANGVNVQAAAKTNMIGVGAGVAVTTASKAGFTGAGSGAVQAVNNNTTATIQNSILTTDKLAIAANNMDKLVTVAGQANVSIGTGIGNVSGGLAWAQNTLDNTAGAYLRGTSITDRRNGVEVSITADNTSSAYAIGVGAGVSTMGIGSANGAYATNRGTDNTEAVAEGYTDSKNGSAAKKNTINRAKSVTVSANDSSTRKAIAGSVNVGVGSYATLGGIVAIDNVGDSSKSQQTRAALNDTDITSGIESEDSHFQGKDVINVKVKDASEILTLALGASVGVTTTNAFNITGTGSVAIANDYKNVTAEIKNTNVDADSNRKSTVNVAAENSSDLTTSGDAVSVSAGLGTVAAALAGAVTIVNSADNTTASIDGGKYNVSNMTLNAQSTAKILDVGVGLGIAATPTAGVNAVGSVINNNIGNSVVASLTNSTVSSRENVGVIADSNTSLRTYAGGLGVSASGSASIGVGGSVAVNKLWGDTKAYVENSDVTAAGNSNDAYELNTYSKKAYGDGEEASSDDSRVTATKTKKSGVVVNADSSEKLVNVVVNGGVAGSGAVAITVNGAVAVDTLQGETSANIKNSNINKGVTDPGTNQKVYVNAHDYTDSSNNAVVASISGSGSVAVSAAAGVAVNNYSHNVYAKITADLDSNNKAAKEVNGTLLDVNAFNNVKALTTVSGLAVAGSGAGAFSALGNVDIENIKAITEARVDGINSVNNGTNINAVHTERIHLHNNGVSASGSIVSGSMALSYGNVLEESQTRASLDNSNVTHTVTTANDTVNADNDVYITNQSVGVSAAASIGAAGLVAAQNVNSKSIIEATAINSSIGDITNTARKAANDVKINATNNIYNKYVNVNVGASVVAAPVVGFSENTIDTQVKTRVVGTNIKANNIDIDSYEVRNIKGTAVGASVGGLSVNSNVINVAMGAALDDDTSGTAATAKDNNGNSHTNEFAENQKNIRYGTTGTTITTALANVKTSSEAGVGGTGSKLQSVSKYVTLNSADVATVSSYDKGGTALNVSSSGSTATAVAGVNSIVSGGTLQADNKLTINANGTSNANITSGSGSLSLAGTALTFANVNNQSKQGITVDGSANLIAKEVAVTALADGNIAMKSVGASVTVGGYQGNTTKVTNSGDTTVKLDSAVIKAVDAVTIEASNTINTDSVAQQYSVGGVNVDNVKAVANETSNTIVNINNSSILAGANASGAVFDSNNAMTGTVNVISKKQNKVHANITSVSVSGVGVGLLKAEATEGSMSGGNATSGIASIKTSGTNILQGNIVNIVASNAPAVSADNTAAVNVGIAKASTMNINAFAYGAANINAAGTTALAANTANIVASVSRIEENSTKLDTVSATLKAISVGGVSLPVVNDAKAINSMSSSVYLGNTEAYTLIPITDSTNTQKVYSSTDLVIASVTDTSEFAKSYGVNVGLGLAVGSNEAIVENNSTTALTIDAGQDNNGTYGQYKSITAGAAQYNYTNAIADGNGGGIINISPVAAVVNYSGNNGATTTVKGSLSTSGKMIFAADTNNEIELLSDAVQASVAGGSGTKLTSTSNAKANMNIADAKLTSGDELQAAADNTIVYGRYDGREYSLKGNGYGAANLGFATYNNTINNDANVNITNSILQSAGTQTIQALNTSDINSKAYLYSAGAISGATLNQNHSLTTNGDITVDNSSLKTTKQDADIILSSADVEDVYMSGYAETSVGLAGGSTVTSEDNYAKRSNTVKVKNNSTIYSLHDAKLLAGEQSNGGLSRLNLNASVTSYNNTLVAVKTKPSFKLKEDQTAYVDIASGNKVYAVRNVELYGDAGNNNPKATASYYDLWQGNNTATASIVQGSSVSSVSVNSENHILENGEIIAGVGNKVEITLGNQTGKSILVVSKEDYNAKTNKSGTTNQDYIILRDDGQNYILMSYDDFAAAASEYFTITKPDGYELSKDQFKFGSYEYGASMFTRLQKLTELMSEYSTDKSSSAYQGYAQEYTRILNTLESLGLEVSKDANGNIIGVNSTLPVNYIEIPDIIASGGNAIINTQKLYSDNNSGSITANGSPAVTINNNTNLELRVNNITVDEPGGSIYYNSNKMGGTTASTGYSEVKDSILKQNISNLGSEKGNVTVGSAKTSEGSGGVITINDTSTLKSFNALLEKVNPDGSIQSGVYSPSSIVIKSNVIIQGAVTANNGTININTQSQGVAVNGSDTEKTGSLTAKTVAISSKDGVISEGYVDDVRQIGGDVKSQYQSGTTRYTITYSYNNGQNTDTTNELTYKEMVDKVTTLAADPRNTNIRINVVDKTVTKLTGSRITANDIYIAAAEINVNGIIQSGYGKYEAFIDSTDATVSAKISAIENNWANNGKQNLSDSAVLNNATYLIKEGSNVLDELNNVYIYSMPVYYNPSTKSLVVPEIDGSGGRVYLSGVITSSGNGYINALDGSYDIAILNTTSYNLSVNNLKVNQVNGLVSITDTANGYKSEITRGEDGTAKITYSSINSSGADAKTAVMGNGTTVALGTKGSSLSNSSSVLKYTPNSGLAFRFADGYKTDCVAHYEREEVAGWFGWSKSHPESWYESYEKANPSTPVQGKRTERPSGIAVIDNSTISGNSGIEFSHTSIDTSSRFNERVDHWSTGYLGSNKHTKYYWDKGTRSTDTWVTTVSGSNPITIQFIGNANGNSTVNVESGGNININGSIGNSELYTSTDSNNVVTSRYEKGTVNLASINGSITQNSGSIYGANVKLVANKANSINITAGDAVNLSYMVTGNDTNNSLAIKVDTNGAAQGNVNVGYIGGLNTVDASGNIIDILNTTSITAKGNISSSTGNEAITYIVFDNGTSGGMSYKSVTKKSSIAGRQLTLASENGSIDTDIQAGTTPINNDTDSASVSASANGNITLRQVSGNMRIGKIYSQNGDVTLTTNGSIEDALPYENTTGETENDLITRWQKMGIIESTNAEGLAVVKQKQVELAKTQLRDNYLNGKNSSGNDNFTAAEKAVYQKFIQGTTLTAEENTIIYGDKTEANPGMLAKLNNAVNATLKTWDTEYQASKTTTDFDSFIIEKAKGEANYANYQYKYWNKDQLLYALSDSIVNPTPGVEYSSANKTVNISAHNITLNVGDKAGVYGASREINLNTLFDKDDKGNLKNLADIKALSKADASTVKYGTSSDGTPIITLTEQLALGIELKDKDSQKGVLNVSSKTSNSSITQDQANAGTGSVFIEGRKGQSNSKDVTIDAIVTSGNVSVKSLGGIYGINGTSSFTREGRFLPNIQGYELYLQAVGGGIGGADSTKSLYISTLIRGRLNVNSFEDVYLSQVESANYDSTLIIDSISTNGDIYITSKTGIKAYANSAQGVIKSANKKGTETKKATIHIEAINGSIGESNAGLRFKNIAYDANGNIPADTVISNIELVALNGSVYVNGISASENSAEPSGSPVISSIKFGQNAYIYSNGDILMGANGVASITSAGSSGTIKAVAANNIYMVNGGSYKATELSMTGKNVNIIDGINKVDGINNSYNVDSLKIIANTGTITQQKNSNDENIAKRSALETTAKVIATAATGIEMNNKYNKLANAVVGISKAGDVYIGNGGDSEFTVTVAGVNGNKLDGDLYVYNYAYGNNNALIYDATAQGDATALVTGSINLISNGTIIGQNANMIAGNNIRLECQGDIGLTNDNLYIYSNKGRINLHSKNGNIYNKNSSIIAAGGLKSPEQEPDAGYYGINISADNGSIINGIYYTDSTGAISVASSKAQIVALNGYVSLTAGSRKSPEDASIINASDIYASNSVILESENGDVYNFDDFSGYQTININTGDTSIVVEGNKQPSGGTRSISDIYLLARNGSLYNSKALYSESGSITLESNNENISDGKDIYAYGDIKLISHSQNVVNKANIVSKEGTITITTDKGSFTNQKGTADENSGGNGSIMALNGKIVIQSAGSLTNTSDLTAKKGITLQTTGKGDVTNTDNFNSLSTEVTNAANNTTYYQANTTQTQPTVKTRLLSRSYSPMLLAASNNREAVDVSVEDVSIIVNDGAAYIHNDLNSTGNIYIWANGNGVTGVAGDENITISGKNVEIGAKSGSITLNKVIADIDNGGIAKIGTVDSGNVEIGEVKGSKVILYTKDKLSIGSLDAENALQITSMGATTSFYRFGTAPVRDGSNYVYYIPKLGTSFDWNCYRQITPTLQYSDAILLRSDPNYHVIRQRYSIESIMGQFANRRADTIFSAMNPDYSRAFDRFAIYTPTLQERAVIVNYDSYNPLNAEQAKDKIQVRKEQ